MCGASTTPDNSFGAPLAPPELLGAAVTEDRRLVTVMIAGLAGPADRADGIDPEAMRYVMASFEDAVARQVERYGGTLGKFGADSVIAFFGAPVAHEDDAQRAINAALDLRIALTDLDHEVLASHGGHALAGVGIDTGEVVSGALAADVQSVYTVVGDTVNTARALGAAARDGEILVGSLTHRLAARAFQVEPVPRVTLEGRPEPIVAFRIIRPLAAQPVCEPSPLVGRTRELDYLLQALDHTRHGRGVSVAVIGEAGVGKSRLLREFATRISGSVRCIAARCASFDTGTPFALVGGLLRAAFQIRAEDDESTARQALLHGLTTLGQVPPESHVSLVLNVLGYGERFPFNPESRRPVLMLILRATLGHGTADAPLVILAEDLHWVDAASAAILGELMSELSRRPCLFVATARPEWDPPWRAETIGLQPLGGQDARVLVGDLMGTATSDDAIDAILRRTGGNPFFVEEVVYDLQVGDSVGTRLSPSSPMPHVPATIQEVLQARLDRLPSGATQVLRIAAVCGAAFSYRVLERLVPSRTLAEDLATLERERFILPTSGHGERGHAFRHALIQEVAYRTQLKSQLREIHRAVAAALESLYANRLDEFVSELAFHYARSDDDGKALSWLVRAGNRARALFANAEALDLYAAALVRAADGLGLLAAGTILEHLGDVQLLVGRYDEAIASFRAGRDRIANPSAVTRARLERKVGTALRIKGAYAEASIAFSSALDTLGGHGDVEASEILLQIGQLSWRTSDYRKAREALTQAVEIATALGEDQLMAEGLKQLGNIPLHAGDAREAVRLFQRSRDIFERLEDLPGIASVRVNLSAAFGRMGRWDECLAELNAALPLFERIGDRMHISMIHNNIGELHRTRGDCLEAIDAFAQAVAISSEVSYAEGIAMALTGLGMARVEAGQLEQGRADLLDAEARFAVLGRSMYLPDIHRSLAAAELAAGNLDAATQAAERSLEFARAANAPHQEAMTQRVLAQVAVARGDEVEARQLLQASRRILAEVGEAAELALTEAALLALGARSA